MKKKEGMKKGTKGEKREIEYDRKEEIKGKSNTEKKKHMRRRKKREKC